MEKIDTKIKTPENKRTTLFQTKLNFGKGEMVISENNCKFIRNLNVFVTALFFILFIASSPIHASTPISAETTEIIEPAETPTLTYQTFQIGDMGVEISNIQSRLNHLGFDCGTVDGVFGSGTTKSVKAFQAAFGFEQNGIVDAITYRALIGRDAPMVSRSASYLVARRIIQSAMSYVGVPYRYGGITPRGFDCSGFTKFVYGQAGINLPRMADAQFLVGEPVIHPNLQTGDLVFFTTYAPGASHVGIYLDNGRFISATSSGGIKVASLHDSYYWGPRYIGARRVL
jgi:hypothetical protein